MSPSHAAQAGQATPENDNAPGQGCVEEQKRGIARARIVAAPADAEQLAEPAAKVRATLAEQLALAGGWVLLDLADGSFLISRWDRSRHCADLRAVAQFARQVGAAA